MDFVTARSSLILHPNSTRSCVRILIIEDLTYENTELFHVNLVSNNDSVTVIRPIASISIEDNDCKFSHLIYVCMLPAKLTTVANE